MQQRRQRSGLTLGLLVFGVLAGVALTASPAQAASGPGPYYAKPAWDQKLPAATRFLVLTNWNSEAVLDRETGLVWERSPALSFLPWIDVRIVCIGSTTGNRKGWRLPFLHELASLIHPTQGNPALPVGHPFLTVQSVFYWSAASNAGDPSRAWGVGFSSGGVSSIVKTDVGLAWCVRGGMHAEAY